MSDDGSRAGHIAMRGMRRLMILVGIGILVMAGATSLASPAHAADDITWTSYDVTIDIREDGTLHVTEHQVVAFDGVYSEGFMAIPLDRVESISNVAVTVEDSNGSLREASQVAETSFSVDTGEFMVEEDRGELVVTYGFPATGNDYFRTDPEQRTIIVEYDVAGAIQNYPDEPDPWQELQWAAISSDVTEIANVEDASVTVTFPEEIAEEQIDTDIPPKSVRPTSVTWSESLLSERDDLDIWLSFPPITAAEAPSWQVRADEQDAARVAAEERSAVAGTMLFAAGLLLVVGGGLAVLITWFTRGRDPQIGLIADIIPEPPDDLPAGLVGALVDEEIHPRDIVAMVLDLDRRGMIEIRDTTEETTSVGFGADTRFSLTLTQPIETAKPYERVVLNAVFGHSAEVGAVQTFDALRGLFAAYEDDVHNAMDQELVKRGFFKESPEVTRTRWERIIKVIPVLGIAVAIAIPVIVDGWTWWIAFPLLASLGLYVVAKRVVPHLPAKTMAGAEAAAKWRAFGRHLEQMNRELQANERTAFLKKYTPWAVAFGMEQGWVDRMNSRIIPPVPSVRYGGGGTTVWADGGSDWGSGRRRSNSGSWSSGPPGSGGGSGWSWGGGPSLGGGGGFSWPDLQGTSDRAGGSLQSGSDSFFSMLGTAMSALSSGSSSSSGRRSSRRSSGSRRSSSRGSRSSGGGRRGFR